MILRLKLKTICVNMLMVLVVLVLLGGLLSAFMRAQVVKERVALMARMAAEAANPRPPAARGEDEARLSWFSLEREADGSLKSGGSGSFDLTDEALLEDILEAAEESQTKTGVLRNYDLRYLRMETPHGQKIVFTDLASERMVLHSLYRAYAVIGLVSAACLLVVSVLLSGWVARPVDEAWRQQKQFVADASHELKTPLAVIMANAELLQQPGYDEAQRRQFTGSILTMAQQMRRLVESLLNLARLDSTQQPPPMETLDVSALCEESVLPFEPVYFERGLLLETEVTPGLCVRGEERGLRQVLDILLDNAGKYSLPGTVRLRLQSVNHQCVLTVSNPAKELSRAQCRDIFKRFYRLDTARTGDGSYGLGLPIAESIVARHGGKLSCSWEDGELRFTATLPLTHAE